jgi:uncharacterized metal-binding protein YceD (DUF177 family)
MEAKRSALNSLVISCKDLPFDGVDLKIDAPFKELCREGDLEEKVFNELCDFFKDPIKIQANLTPVGGSKLSLKGSFETYAYNECDRCMAAVRTKIRGDLTTFLMSTEENAEDDANFGAFDGEHLDLRPLVRELMVLELPMQNLCAPEGQAERLDGNIEECARLKDKIEGKSPSKGESALAQALKSKIKS